MSEFKGLIETMAFTATTVGDDTPAAHAGMEGEYVVLEFADWTLDSDSSLFDKNAELQGKCVLKYAFLQLNTNQIAHM